MTAQPPENSDDEAKLLFVKKHHADYSFWQEWILDKISKQSSDTMQLFEKALSQCPCPEMVLDFLDYCSKIYEDEIINEEIMRQCFEKAVLIGGIDIYTGGMIWKRYREFEEDEHDDLLETANDAAEILISKKRVVSLYHRQLALPLAGNDRVLKEMDSALSKICDESDLSYIQPDKIQKQFQSAKKELSNRLVFEDYIMSAQFEPESLDESQRWKTWKAYIALEVKEENYPRAQRLFERAAINCKNTIELWNDYLEFAISTIKSASLLCNVTERALILLSGDIDIWVERFLSLETLNRESELFDAFSEAIVSSFQSAEDYLTVLFSKISYIRRKIQSIFESKDCSLILLSETIQVLRMAYTELDNFLIQYYSDWLEGWLKVFRFQVSIEDEVIELISDRFTSLPTSELDSEPFALVSIAKHIWEGAVSRFGKFYYTWKDYISWSRFHQSISETRKLYKRMVALVSDYPEQVIQDWKQFEFQSGGIVDVQSCLIRSKPILIKLKQSYTQPESKPETGNKSILKRSRDETPPSNTEKRAKIVESVENVSRSDTINSKPSEIEDLAKSNTEPKNEITLCMGVVIKNISFSTTIEAVKRHFESCGTIVSAELMLSKSGKSRGLVNMIFENSSSVDNAMSLNQSELEGRPLVVEKWTPDPLNIKSTPAEDISGSRTVFVSKFSLSYTEEELKEFMSQFGEISDIKLSVDKHTKKSKGTALIEFSTVKGRADVMKANKKLKDKDGNVVSILPSKFQIKKPKDTSGNDQKIEDSEAVNNDNTNPYLSGKDDPAQPPTRQIGIKSHLAFKPRGVKILTK